MIEAGASWAVEYHDGSVECRFNADGSERPWVGIRWTDVKHVAFMSADAEGSFDFEHPGPEYTVRLGSRTAMAALTGDDGEVIPAVRAMMIVTTPKDAPVNDATVLRMFFWYPDGTYHDCDQYNCKDAAAYLNGLVYGSAPVLAQSHSRLDATTSIALVAADGDNNATH